MLALTAACFAMVSAGSIARAATKSDSSVPPVTVMTLQPSPDYLTSGVIVGIGALQRCSSQCNRLVISHDGGASWSLATASGWSGGDIVAVAGTWGRRLVSASSSGLMISADDGATFSPPSGPSGSVTTPWGQGSTLLVAGSNAAWHTVDVRSHATSAVPGPQPPLDSASAVAVPPGDAATGALAGFAVGFDRSTGFPTLERCDQGWACSAPTVIEPKKDGVLLTVSPAFARDGTLFARAAQAGTLLRSTNGGQTFAPVAVSPPGAANLINSVLDVSLSLDFSASPPRGHAYASVVSVAGQPGGAATVTGGVFRSDDGGASWVRIGAGSLLDHGSTAVTALPDGHVVAAYLDVSDRQAGLLCWDGVAWRSACHLAEDGRGDDNMRGAGSAAVAQPSGRAGQGGLGTEPNGSRDDAAAHHYRLATTRPGQAATVSWRSPTTIAAVLALTFLIAASVARRRRRCTPV